MKFSLLKTPFKHYLLHERGLTARQYKAVVTIMQRLCDYYQNERIDLFSTEKIRGFLTETSRLRAWSPKTFRNCRQNLKCFFAWAQATGHIKKNPVLAIAIPKVPKTLPRFLTKREAETIFSQTRWQTWQSNALRSRNETIIATFLYSGLRLSELLNLRFADIDLDQQIIRVVKGKGQKDRLVPIHPRLLPLLMAHGATVKDKTGWLFTGARSCKRLTPRDIYHICRRISSAANIYFTPHMLRHTFGRLMVEADFNIFKLKEIMGHSDVSTTQIYMSVSTDGIARSFNKIELF